MWTEFGGRKALLCVAAASGVLCLPGFGRADVAKSADMRQRDRWAKDHLSGPAAKLPFTFQYGGQSSSGLLPTWERVVGPAKVEGFRARQALSWSDPKTGLQVRCESVRYAGYPVVEWTLYFKNAGDKDTPILSDIQALDTVFEKESLLHHFKGDSCSKDSFEPLETPLTSGIDLRFAPTGGRASNGEWPYYNLERPGGGVMLAVGWPGQWASRFSREPGEGVRVCAGQELTHFTLHPGEEVRSPLIALMFYKGDWISGQNLWRRWMLAQSFPRDHGKTPAPSLAGFCGNSFPEYVTDQKGELEFFDRYAEERIGLDSWWMDAGWYPCSGAWGNVGTWEVDRNRFPDGLRAISDQVHARRMRYILWFEPERVAAGTRLADNHPEWVLGGKNGGLLNFGNPEAWKWITHRIDKIIVDEGVDLYRQDFNMDPLPYWRGNDAQDRQGITEIKHVEGYLAFWDELQQRHPGMLIDSCASGGRRDDLESMRRALPFLRSDYCTDPEGMQCHTYGFGLWLPYYRGATDNLDTYTWRSNLSPLMMPAWDMRDKKLDYGKARNLVAEWRTVAPFMFGDFYPLTRYSIADDEWISFQFDLPENGKGMVQAFRRKDCAGESIVVRLRGLDVRGTYVLTDLDSEVKKEASGRKLMEEGLTLRLSGRPAAAVVIYSKKRIGSAGDDR